MTPHAQRNQLNTTASSKDRRELERLAALEYLRAVRPGVDHVLQELVEEVRGVFGTELCLVDLALSDVQYFRAWSGELPPDKAEARQDPLENSMCQYVVNDERPLVVKDFMATEEFREQYWCVNYGIRFYAGTPLITSGGHAIGTLCLLSTRAVEFSEEQMKVLGAFARAVVGRLELLGALEREQAAKEEEAQRSQELQQTLDSLSAHIAILDESGEIIAVNGVWRAFAEANGATRGGSPRRQLPAGLRIGGGSKRRRSRRLRGGSKGRALRPARELRDGIPLPLDHRATLVHRKGYAFLQQREAVGGGRPREHYRAEAGRGENA